MARLTAGVSSARPSPLAPNARTSKTPAAWLTGLPARVGRVRWLPAVGAQKSAATRHAAEMTFVDIAGTLGRAVIAA
jgi:hypothetical protein